MASADTYLKRLVIILSVVLVSLLAIASILSVLPDDKADEDQVVNGPASPERSYPGQIFDIEDNEFPLSVGCRSGLDEENVFLVLIQNRGARAADYLVVADLSDPDGNFVEAVADIPDLRPGEQRESVLLPRESLDGVNSCSIVAVEGDRRILLGR